MHHVPQNTHFVSTLTESLRQHFIHMYQSKVVEIKQIITPKQREKIQIYIEREGEKKHTQNWLDKFNIFRWRHNARFAISENLFASSIEFLNPWHSYFLPLPLLLQLSVLVTLSIDFLRHHQSKYWIIRENTKEKKRAGTILLFYEQYLHMYHLLWKQRKWNFTNLWCCAAVLRVKDYFNGKKLRCI